MNPRDVGRVECNFRGVIIGEMLRRTGIGAIDERSEVLTNQKRFYFGLQKKIVCFR